MSEYLFFLIAIIVCTVGFVLYLIIKGKKREAREEQIKSALPTEKKRIIKEIQDEMCAFSSYWDDGCPRCGTRTHVHAITLTGGGNPYDHEVKKVSYGKTIHYHCPKCSHSWQAKLPYRFNIECKNESITDLACRELRGYSGDYYTGMVTFITETNTIVAKVN